MEYESLKTIESKCAAGVRYTIYRMSFGRRIQLTKKIWELAGRAEFLNASSDAREKLEAAMLASEIDRAYLAWGLAGIDGLTIDGAAATPELMSAQGPEALCREIVAAIKAECGLSDEERKN